MSEAVLDFGIVFRPDGQEQKTILNNNYYDVTYVIFIHSLRSAHIFASESDQVRENSNRVQPVSDSYSLFMSEPEPRQRRDEKMR